MCVCARVLLGSFLLCFAWHESTTTLCLEHWVAWLCFVHAWFHCLLFFIYCKLQQHTKLPCHSIARIQQLCSTTKCCNNRDNGGPLFSLIYIIITTKFCIYTTVWPPNSRFLGPGIFREFEIRELKIWSLTTPNSQFSSQFTDLAATKNYKQCCCCCCCCC